MWCGRGQRLRATKAINAARPWKPAPSSTWPRNRIETLLREPDAAATLAVGHVRHSLVSPPTMRVITQPGVGLFTEDKARLGKALVPACHVGRKEEG
jgi:hypothetical protein